MMLKVLIVDDDFMVADCLEEILVDAGYEVCGIAGTVADAIEMGERLRPDLGVIDVRLSDGELGTTVAAALRRRGHFGVLYATGNPDHPVLTGAEGEGCIAKPYLAAAMVSALHVVSDRMANLAPALPLPPGFRLLGA